MTVVTQVLTGAFLSIRSIWLVNHPILTHRTVCYTNHRLGGIGRVVPIGQSPHGVNDVIKQVLQLFQYTCLTRRTYMQDLAWNVTWHNKTIVWNVGSEEMSNEKNKALFIIVYKQTYTFCIIHMVNQPINYFFAFSLICWDLKYWSVKLLEIRTCADSPITSLPYWPNRQGWPNR